MTYSHRSFTVLPPTQLTMPNQRDPDKRKLNAWMYERDIEVLKAVAEEEGITLTDLLVRLTDELRKKNKKKLND